MIVVTTTTEAAAALVIDGPDRQVGTLSYRWRGWTGDEWNLVDPASKVWKVRGATGFGFAPVTHWYGDAPGIPGSSWDGSHDDSGHLFLPVEVRGSDSADFLTQHRTFLRTLDPAQEGVLTVTTPDGRLRWTRCRYADGADASVDIDPVASCGVRYGITWNRDDPYWLGDTVTAKFTDDPPPPFFAPPGSTYVVAIASSTVLDTATVSNPGDVPSYPKWTITGPCETFEVGLPGGVLAMAPALAADETITVDMDPRSLQILDQDGTDLGLGAATDVSFEPIPAGDNIPLTVTATGTGVGFSIVLEFTARYRSAW